MAMDPETQVNLLNETLGVISELLKQNPEFKSLVNNLFKNNTCFIDNDTDKLLEFMISTFEISNTDIIQRIQSGGAPVDDDEVALDNNAMVADNNAMVAVNNENAMGPGNNVQVVTQPDNSLTIIGNIFMSPNLSPENQAALIKILGEKVSADNQLIEAKAEGIKAQATLLADNAIWDQRFEALMYTFAFTSPAALMYMFQNCLDQIAVQTVSVTGKAAAGLAGGVELGVRNAVPFMIQSSKELGKLGKDYLPTILVELGRWVSTISAAQYATKAVGEEAINDAVKGVTEGTGSVILFGCILLWIALTLFFCILVLTIVKLRKINRVALQIPFAQIAIQTSEKGGRKRKTKKKKNIRKKTRRRHNNKK